MNNSSTVDVLEQALERLEVSDVCPLRERGDSVLPCLLDDADEETPQDAIDCNHFIEPNDELVKKIVQQCEYYFCDANIAVDQFLLKHIRRNKDGWVSLKLIACFRKIKRLTRDYRQVQVALRKASTTLEVSADGNKLRRKDPLTFVDDGFSRSVIVFKASPSTSTASADAAAAADYLCPKWLLGEMQQFGTIVDVRLVKSGAELPVDLRFVAKRHPQLGQQSCAIVKFDKADAAEHACAVLNGNDFGCEGRASRETNWRAATSSPRACDGLRARIVRPLAKPSSDTSSAGGTPSPCCSPRSNRRLTGGNNTSFSAGNSPHRGSPLSDFATSSQRDSPRIYSRSVCNSAMSKNCKPFLSSNSQTPQSSPWSSPDVRRKVMVEATVIQSQQPTCLLRQPFGPDGSSGFKN